MKRLRYTRDTFGTSGDNETVIIRNYHLWLDGGLWSVTTQPNQLGYNWKAPVVRLTAGAPLMAGLVNSRRRVDAGEYFSAWERRARLIIDPMDNDLGLDHR